MLHLDYPVPNNRSQNFGDNPEYYKNVANQLGHNGIDFAVPAGTPVKAPADAVVHFEGYGQNIGLMGSVAGISIILDHDEVMTGYAHLMNTVVNSGQYVKRGDIIGYTDTTGQATGPHLHFEVFGKPVNTSNGYYGRINPEPYLAPVPVDAPLRGYQRIVNAAGVNYRRAPSAGAEKIDLFLPGYTYDFKGFVRGENINGNDIWFVGLYTGGYAWSGAFEDSGTHDLPDLTPVTIPQTPIPSEPISLPYNFIKDIPAVTDVDPAAEGNFQYGNFPDKPLKVIIHDMGTKGRDNYGTTINEFNRINAEKSTHFVAGMRDGKAVLTQMVSLKDRAYGAGVNGNDFIQFETEPEQHPEMIALVKLAIKQLNEMYGYKLELIKHSEIMITSCGDDVDLSLYEVDEVVPEVPEDPTVPVNPTTPDEPKPDVINWKSVIDAIVGFIKSIIERFRK